MRTSASIRGKTRNSMGEMPRVFNASVSSFTSIVPSCAAKAAPVRPAGTYYDQGLGQFILPYDAIRLAPSPDADLLDYLDSTYAAAADLGHWDRAALERTRQDAT